MDIMVFDRDFKRHFIVFSWVNHGFCCPTMSNYVQLTNLIRLGLSENGDITVMVIIWGDFF
jgi:hypothetical protein